MAAGALPVFWTSSPHPDHRPGPGRGGHHPPHPGHHAGPPRPPDGRHGPDHRDRRAPRLALVEDCAHAHGQRWRDRGAGSIGEFGSFSHQSTKILTAGEGGTLLTDDERPRPPGPLADRLRPGQGRRREGVHLRGELPAGRAARRPLLRGLERLPGQQAQRAEAAGWFEELAARLGRPAAPPDPRITRWSFYRYILAIEPEAFAGATNQRVCEALEAEGVGAGRATSR